MVSRGLVFVGEYLIWLVSSCIPMAIHSKPKPFHVESCIKNLNAILRL